MRTIANYTGRKFGLITVMECLEESDGSNKGGLWQCKCKCGKLITLAGYSLHHRESCGCLGKIAARKRGVGNRKPQQVTHTAAYHRYKRSALSPMSKGEWLAIVQNPCWYCGNVDTINEATRGHYKSVIPLLPEDEAEYQAHINQVVMTEGSIVSCCSLCRTMRDELTHEQFLEHIRTISSYVQQPK